MITLPNLFTSTVTCIGKFVIHHNSKICGNYWIIGEDFNGFGSCKGDSGGAVIRHDTIDGHFEQIALVQGGVGGCGERTLPGIYIRLKDPEIHSFIRESMGRFL